LGLAQLPPPFGPPEDPQLPARKCTPQLKKMLESQIEGWKQLQNLSRNQGETLCSLVDNADDLGKFADGKLIEQLLPEDVRTFVRALGIDFAKMDVRALMKLMGIDLSQIDLRKLKHQCRLSQGELDRLATSEIGRLKQELQNCDDTI
jgi:hypothetical protein